MIESDKIKRLPIELSERALSENGQRRRDFMLDDLQLQMQQIHKTRKRRRRIVAANGVLFGLVALALSQIVSIPVKRSSAFDRE